MMLSLLKNERFLSEYKQWKMKIDSLGEGVQKKELQDLMNKLINEVKRLDTFHEELVISHKLPMDMQESKLRISEIRKKIQKRINDIRT